MKYCIDPEEIKKEKLPISTLLFILALYLKDTITPDTFEDVCKRGFVEYDGFDLLNQPINLRLTDRGIEQVETVVLNSEFPTNENQEDDFTRIADKLRELYPKGRKNGTNCMWRDSTQIIAKRLKAIVKKFDIHFTEEEAVEATRKYVNSFNGDYQYMQVLKYFLLKLDKYTGEESSQFLSYLQNEEETTVNTNWMETLR